LNAVARRTRTYLGWARSLAAPRARLLPGLGARLQARPRLFAAVLLALQKSPRGRVRAAVFGNISRPLIARNVVLLDVAVAGGSRMLVGTSDLIGRVLAVSGIWEPPVTMTFREILQPGDVCVDVGANIGYFTLLASRLVGPDGRVYALEPSGEAHAMLLANLNRNAATNVTALDVAAGAGDGESELYYAHPRNRGASTLRAEAAVSEEEGSRTALVRVRALSSVISEADVPRLRLVKIDVEGFELEVLRGLAPLFDHGARSVIVVESNPEWTGVAGLSYIADFCRRHGLEVYGLAREPLFSGRGLGKFEPVQIDSIPREQGELLLAPPEVSVRWRSSYRR
jgi:FkbM family methyltransferase